MRRKMMGVIALCALALGLVAVAYAAPDIKVVVDGQELKPDVVPRLVDGRVLAPVRAVAEALGAEVSWDEGTGTVTIASGKANAVESRVSLLEEALAPRDALTALTRWADGVKSRNGALQYAVMSPDLRKQHLADLVASNWCTGTSSPWVQGYEITESGKDESGAHRYQVVFTYTDSTKKLYTIKEHVTVGNYDGTWLVSSTERVDVAGRIKQITPADDGKSVRILVEGNDNSWPYDKAVVAVGSDTKIVSVEKGSQLTAEDLKIDTKVEVTFAGPVLMTYPVQGGAKTIRVFE